ncbi:unnamed protein product [Polarella glacialis]|uniref:CSD domain-containing protein n=1 Tax=Polarella glacialis TaxID=89957 RepID=A0A813L8V2_POLGL|nr:unnamed protein product [Polarella glacialis]CAE8723726.1 unnamed protein product [Polarella glacialis]
MDPNTLIELLSAMDGETGVQIILEVLKARPGISPQVIKFACPALTYAPARGMQERRCRGVLKNFNQEKGYGFIASPEIEAIFGTDTFVHAKQVGGFEVGEEVSFSCVIAEENKPQAFELLTAGGLPGGSATGGQSSGAWGGSWGGDSNSWGGSEWDGGMGGGMGCGMGCGMNGGMGGGMGMIGWEEMNEAKRRRTIPPEVTDAPAIGEFTGVIKSFSDKNGFGFIQCNELQMHGHVTWLHLV